MATIKLQDGNVILKNGNASCSCCGCNESFNITDPNVFEITKQKYDQYFNGGIWQITAEVNVNYTGRYDGNLAQKGSEVASASGSTTFSQFRSGCFHNISRLGLIGTYQQTITYDNGPPTTFSGSFGSAISLGVKLKKVGEKYYVRYAAAFIAETIGGRLERGFVINPPNEEYPIQIQSMVDSNNILIYKKGRQPVWRLLLPPTPSIPFTTYNETSSATLNATFTPA